MKKNFLSDISIFDSSKIDEVSLAGYQKERFQLEHIFRVFKKEELCFGNVLLYGPPGTGKTESVFQSLRTVNIPFMRITPRHIFNKYYSPQESLDLILKKIKDQKQCVVIFEEVDMLSQKRELPSTDQKVTIAMLLFFDELKKMNTSRTNKIMTVSTTNYKELLDPAFLRPGRTDKILYFDNTNHQNKREIIDLYMKKYEVNLSDEEIALLINKESISPAEIENALKEKFFLKKSIHSIS